MDDPNEVLRQATGGDDPQEVLNQAMGIRYKGQYDGNIFNRSIEAAQDFGNNAIDELKGWSGKVAADVSVIKPVQMVDRSNEDIQADTDAQNQQLGQLYGDAVANPAGKVAITPFVPAPVRAAAGLLYMPELAKDVHDNYQANLDDPKEVLQAATGGDDGSLNRYANAAGKTAYQTLVDPIVQPVKNLISNPGQFGQDIVNDPSKLWSDLLLPGAIAKGGYDVSKKTVDGVKDQYGDAMNTLDNMDQSIPKAPDAAMMDDPTEVLRQAQGNVPQVTAPTPQTGGGTDSFIRAISGQESGSTEGNYDAENGRTGAAGRFQIMPDNWASWAEDAGLSPDAPMTPENQNIVARHKFEEYYNEFGNWRDVATAWYAGPDAVKWSEEAKNRAQGNGDEPSINEYADSVMARMGNDAGKPATGIDTPPRYNSDTSVDDALDTNPSTTANNENTDILGQPLNHANDDRPISQDEQIKADIEKSLNGEPIDSSGPVKNDVSAADLLNGENKKYSFDFSGDPSQINSRDWYHGSGTAGLSPDNLTTNSTNIEGLFGHGVYLTDNLDIAKGYASARSRRTKTPTVYQANVNVDNVLNLEKQMPNQAYDVFHNAAESIANRYDYPEILSDIEKAKNENGESVYKALSSGISDLSQDLQIPKSEFVEDFQDLSANLKNAGYDAYTHVGGKRTGKDSHQVLIMLDPSDELSLTGRTRQITKFSPYDVNKEHSGIEFSRVPTQKEFTSEIDNMIEQAKQPEQMRGVNEEMLNKAQDAAMNGDYATAAEYARQAGADDWAKSFQLVANTDGGSKPIAPRLDTKPTSEYKGDTITKRQIMKRAAELFVPIRAGRIGEVNVMGFVDHSTGIIRTRDYGDLNTIAHEIGHITDAALGLRGEAGAFDHEFSRVVDNRFGKDAYEPEQKRAEGIAEFMKDYLTNENNAKAEMPAYYSQFKAALEKNPDIKGRVNEIKSMVKTWQRQSPEARGRAAVSYADEMKPNLKERAKQAKLKFVEDWVDDKVGLKRVSESYERATGERLATKDDPYKMARLAQNSSVARAQMLVEGDKPALVKAALNKVYGNIIDKVVTIKGVLKELDASPELKDHQDYLKAGNFKNWHEALDSLLIARRQAEIQKIYHGYKGPMSPDDAQAIISRAPQALNDAAKKIYTYNDNILRILKENGMIKPEVYDNLTKKYQNYVPMARDFADESGLEKGFGMGGQGFGNVRAALKSISEKGSTRQVVSPLESTVKNTYAMLNLVERNRVGQTFIKMADGDRVGKLVEEVTGTANTKDSTFSVWQNGEKKLYQTEPEIYRAIMSVNKDTANIITKLLSPPAQLLRAGATLMPDFAIKNIVRDSFGAAVFSRYGFRPIVDHAAGIFHMVKQDELFHEYKASGALMSTMVGLDRDYIQGSLKGLYKKDAAYYWNHYNPVQVMRGFSEMLETATRLGEYSRAVSKGVSVEDAALSARDISLDFSQHGVYGKTANKVIAFFNAGVQEPVRIIQAFKENPVGTTAKVAMYITLPSVALWAMNHDQQWYKELPAYQKNLFWCFKAGDTVYRIPKPFGLGVLFGSMPERMLDYMETRRPQEMKEWASSAAGAFLPNFMPTAVGPIIEWATNYSFFQGRSIVPQKEQKLPDEMQYGTNTSELAKEIGSIFGVSPRKIDNTISGYGAGMANQALNAADALSGAREYQNPFQKAFTVDPMKSPQSVQDFYDKLDEVQKAYNGAKATKTELDSDTLHNYNLLNYANQNMEYINKMERLATQKGDDSRVADLKKKQLDIAQKSMAKVRY